MGPLFYIMRRSFINHIKDLKNKPAALIGYILLTVFVVGMIVIGLVMPSESNQLPSVELFELIVAGVVLFMSYIFIKAGLTNGASYFRQADVNFVFVSPFSTKKVLVYGFIKELYKTFLIMFFFVFQISTLKSAFGVKNSGLILVFGGLFILIFALSITSMLMYSFTSKSKQAKKRFELGMRGFIIILIVFFMFFFMPDKDILGAAESVFASKVYAFIPLLGWTKEIIMGGITGITTMTIVSIVLMFLYIVGAIMLILTVNADYYEDVLKATETLEEVYELKKQGKQMLYMKNRKVRKVKGEITATGAKTIFQRHMLEYRKSGFFFLDGATIGVLLGGLIFGFSMNKAGMGIEPMLYFSIYMLFIFSFQGKWMYEISKPFIYMIPASSEAKVFYATLAENIKHFVDGVILFVIGGIITKSDPLTIVCCIIVFTSFGAVFTYTDVWCRKTFGGVHSKVFQAIFRILIMLVVLVPSIAIQIFLNIRFEDFFFGKYLGFCGMIVYNVILAAILLVTSKSIFEKYEMK
ncbi:putative ABC exporter domain-containing protein [Clostridium sp. DL1XJH146]